MKTKTNTFYPWRGFVVQCGCVSEPRSMCEWLGSPSCQHQDDHSHYASKHPYMVHPCIMAGLKRDKGRTVFAWLSFSPACPFTHGKKGSASSGFWREKRKPSGGFLHKPCIDSIRLLSPRFASVVHAMADSDKNGGIVNGARTHVRNKTAQPTTTKNGVANVKFAFIHSSLPLCYAGNGNLMPYDASHRQPNR